MNNLLKLIIGIKYVLCIYIVVARIYLRCSNVIIYIVKNTPIIKGFTKLSRVRDELKVGEAKKKNQVYIYDVKINEDYAS